MKPRVHQPPAIRNPRSLCVLLHLQQRILIAVAARHHRVVRSRAGRLVAIAWAVARIVCEVALASVRVATYIGGVAHSIDNTQHLSLTVEHTSS